jgi:hypothetical protein
VPAERHTPIAVERGRYALMADVLLNAFGGSVGSPVVMISTPVHSKYASCAERRWLPGKAFHAPCQPGNSRSRYPNFAAVARKERDLR